MLWKFRIFLGHLPGQGGCFIFGFSAHYITQMLQLFTGHLHGHGGYFFWVFRTLHHPDAPAFLGTFTWTQGLFFSGFPHTTSSRCSGFAGDIYLDRGCFFQVFHALHHPVAPVLLGTFTRTQEWLFLGFPHTTSSRCSSFSWDIYPDMGVVFFRVFCTLHHPVALVLLRTFIQTQGLFFSGFPHTASSSCSGFAKDIYLDTGVVSFGFSTHCIIQLLRFCSGHLSGHRGCFFGFSAHCIIQLLQFCLGRLPGHRSGFFWVFCTLRHPDAPAFLGTFKWTWGLFFSGFPHTTSFSRSDFAWDIYPDTGVGFFGFSAHYIMKILQLFLGHLPGHGGCFFGFSAHYIIQLLRCFSGH